MLPKEYCFAPSVFAVGENYIICTWLNVEATALVKIGDDVFYDSSNGILRSKKSLHIIEVPMDVLDKVGEYTLIVREFTDRCPYFPKSCEPSEYTVKFKGISDKEEIRISYLSDTHGRTEAPIKAASYFGDSLDLLVLGGDIADHSGEIENFKTLYALAGAVTGGKVPCIFTRGNHDLRGACAEMLADYTPTNGGKSYFTTRLGPLWALCLDCGEDKNDGCNEYGHTVACHDFRLRETAFINKVIEKKSAEYEADGVKYKLLMSHVPFAQRYEDPFNPEEEIYTEWCRLCREEIKPELWLCGHKHVARISRVGGELDHFGQPCDCVIGARPNFTEGTFVSAHIILGKNSDKVIFFDDGGNIVGEDTVTK